MMAPARSSKGPILNADNRRIPNSLAALIGIAGLLLFIRALVGVGFWGDEPFGLSTALRYALGDRPLIDSWDTNFSSAIVATPFVKAYVALTGSTEGILLAYRFVWLGVVAVTALCAFIALKPHLPRSVVAVFTAMTILYLPYLSPYMGYGADWSLYLLVGFSLLMVNREGLPPTLNWIPGALTGLAILGNPPTLTAVPFIIAALLFMHRTDVRRRNAALLSYLAATAVVGAIFVIALVSMSGREAFAGIARLGSADDHDFGLTAQLSRLWAGKYMLALPTLAGIGSGLWWRSRPALGATRVIAVSFIASTALSAVAIVLRRIATLHAPQAVVFGAALAVCVAFVVAGRAALSRYQILLLAVAGGASVGWFVGSNGGLATAIQAAPLMLAAALMWQGEAAAAKSSNAASRLLIVALLGVLLVAAAIGLRYTPEGVTTRMTSRVESGPFQGIFATPEEAGRIASIDRALATLPPATGPVVFLERYPLGYLSTMQVPGTYSTWATSADTTRLQEYIDATGRQPQRLILTTFASNLEDGAFPGTVRIKRFAEYQPVYEDDELRVLDRR